MNPSRNSKKRALEKLSTMKNTKKTCNNQEIEDDFNDLLTNTDITQSKNAKNASKKGRKKTVQKTNAKDKTTKETKQNYKGLEGINDAIPPPQIIDEVLNDNDSLNEDDNDVPDDNNDPNEDDNENDNDATNNNDDNAYETITPSVPMPTLEKEANSQNDKEMETNRRSMSVIDSRTNNQNEFSSNSVLGSRTGSQNNDFTSPRKVLSRPNPALLNIDSTRPNLTLLNINSQDDGHFSSSRTTSRLNSRSQLGFNSQDVDYSSRSNSRSQIQDDNYFFSRLNSRPQLGVNNQDDDYFAPSGRRTSGLDHYDYSN